MHSGGRKLTRVSYPLTLHHGAMAKSKRWRGGRTLLNDPGFHSTAALVAEIEDTSYWPEGKNGDGYDLNSSWRLQPVTTFQITDCDKKVSFDIDWESPALMRNSLKKVRRMLKVLTAFEAALVDEQKLYNERKKDL